MLRAAIIGCGGIAGRHVRGFSIHGRCEVVAGVDVDSNSLERTCDGLGIPRRYHDQDEMLRQEQPDVVAICTWPGSHASITMACAAAEVKGILCEKPLAVSPRECDEMIEACHRAGAVLGVGYQLRFLPSNVAAKALIASGDLGRILMLRSTSKDGLSNNASHWIDLARFLLGDLARFLLGDPAPEWVIGQVERSTDRYERGMPIEDFAVADIGLGGGHRMLVESDLSREQANLLVVGERGAIRCEGQTAILQPSDGGPIELEGMDAPSQHLSFLKWMEGGTDYVAEAENGRRAIECIAAIFESVRQHRRVSFPLPGREYPLPEMIASGELPLVEAGPYDIRGGGPRWRPGGDR